MRSRWLAVVILCLGSPAALAQAQLLDLISDTGGPGATEPTVMPGSDSFLASPDVSEAAASGLTLAIRSLRGPMYWWYWASATVVGGEGDDVRSVEYRFRNEGKDVHATVTDKAPLFALVIKLSSQPTIEAHVTVARRGKQMEEVVVLRAPVPGPGVKAATRLRDQGGPKPPPRVAGSPANAGALPAGVRFSVVATPAMMTGGYDSGWDIFKFLLEGDAKGLSQISRVEYSLSAVEAGDRRGNFFLDGTFSRDRWPIAVKITWRNGKITHASLARP